MPTSALYAVACYRPSTAPRRRRLRVHARPWDGRSLVVDGAWQPLLTEPEWARLQQRRIESADDQTDVLALPVVRVGLDALANGTHRGINAPTNPKHPLQTRQPNRKIRPRSVEIGAPARGPFSRAHSAGGRGGRTGPTVAGSHPPRAAKVRIGWSEDDAAARVRVVASGAPARAPTPGAVPARFAAGRPTSPLRAGAVSRRDPPVLPRPRSANCSAGAASSAMAMASPSPYARPASAAVTSTGSTSSPKGNGRGMRPLLVPGSPLVAPSAAVPRSPPADGTHHYLKASGPKRRAAD